ncbi:MAG: hypothetical protein JWR01_100, partial [Subtercola sp.]|nr:hypothetical protein [Subtercola sp.]
MLPARPSARRLESERLVLEPLRVGHAQAMVDVLADAALYRFTGGEPPSIQQLTARYERQLAGPSPDGREQWLNWIVCRRDGTALGFVQATVSGELPLTAEVAWVVATGQQGRGLATEAAGAMLGWLRETVGVTVFVAFIHPDHGAS